MAGNITEVTDINFQAEVLESETPVLVDFWAPWCGPCRVVAPVLEEIAGERDDLRIVKLNIDDNQQTAAQFGIMAIPTMLVFRDGAEAHRIQGAMPKKRLEAELEPVLAPSA
jgi:thioredoxin 1